MNCKTCKHWLPKKEQLLNCRGEYAKPDQGGETPGECRGATPKFVHGKGGPFRVFPVTIASDWCGAWAQGAIVEDEKPTETASTSAPAVIVEQSAEPKRRGRPPKNSV